MTDDLDPRIQALFAGAEEDLTDEAFTAGVMSRAAAQRRRAALRRVVFGTALVLAALLLASPLQDAAALLASFVTLPLLPLENTALAQLTLPVNNVAFPLALALLALRAVRRRLFS